MALIKRLPGLMDAAATQAAVSDGMVVVVGTADNTVTLPSGADPVSGVVGVVFRPDGTTAAIGATVDYVMTGVYPLIAAGTIARGDRIAVANSSGGVKTAAPSAGTNTMILGTALESAVSGDRFAAALQISVMQG